MEEEYKSFDEIIQEQKDAINRLYDAKIKKNRYSVEEN